MLTQGLNCLGGRSAHSRAALFFFAFWTCLRKASTNALPPSAAQRSWAGLPSHVLLAVRCLTNIRDMRPTGCQAQTF